MENSATGKGNGDFRSGALAWFSGPMTVEAIKKEYLNRKWDDGFAAFSNGEVRLDEDTMAALADLLAGRRLQEGDVALRKKFAGFEGFLMEAGLWRRSQEKGEKKVLEELAFEREGEGFFVQYWRLEPEKAAGDGGLSCWWRPAATFVRGNLKKLFPEGKVATREVVVPEYRLRFYLTEGV